MDNDPLLHILFELQGIKLEMRPPHLPSSIGDIDHIIYDLHRFGSENGLPTKPVRTEITDKFIIVSGELTGNGFLFPGNGVELIHPVKVVVYYPNGREGAAQKPVRPLELEIYLNRPPTLNLSYRFSYSENRGLFSADGLAPVVMDSKEAVRMILRQARDLKVNHH